MELICPDIEDSQTNRDYPYESGGNLTILTIREGSPNLNAWLKFDVRSVKNKQINSIKLYVYGLIGTEVVDYFAIAKTSSNWGEYTINWNNQPPPEIILYGPKGVRFTSSGWQVFTLPVDKLGEIKEDYLSLVLYNSKIGSGIDSVKIYSMNKGSAYAPYLLVNYTLIEGLLDITGITAPSAAHPGDIVNFIIHTKNIGVDDNFRIELIGDITGFQEFFLGSNLTKDVPFSFIMPDKNVSITAKTYHLE